MIIPDYMSIKLILSIGCYQRLDSDSKLCYISKSKLIENIITVFCRKSKQIKELTFSEKESEGITAKLFENDNNIIFFKTFSKLLVNAGDQNNYFSRRRNLKGKKKIYQWTVTKLAADSLRNDTLSKNESSPFISELLEEYSTLDYGIRERIMFLDRIDKIDEAIENNRKIKFTSKSGNPHTISPYKIMTEPDLRYNYLICDNFDGGAKFGSIRIFNMKNIKIIKAQQSKVDEIKIDNLLSERSIPYLQSESEIIEVLLNKQGEENYRSLLHNRPRLVSHENEYKNGFKRYLFECSQFQAKIYFLGFGTTALVIKPQKLADEIKAFYKEAFDFYNK